MFAVVEAQGHQYRVEEKDVIQVGRLNLPEKEKYVVNTVLLVSDGKKVDIGKPYLEKAAVEFSVVKHLRGKKLRILKFKTKTRSSNTVQGHRDDLTELKVEKIKVG